MGKNAKCFILILLLAVLFNNCGQGFKSVNFSELRSSIETEGCKNGRGRCNSPTPTPSSTPLTPSPTPTVGPSPISSPTPTPIPSPSPTPSEPPTAGNSVAHLAASLLPGQWGEVTGMSGWNKGGILSPADLGCTPSDYITQYAEKAAWDPIQKRLLFIGQSHGYCYGGRFVIFETEKNTWSQGQYPPGICQSGTSDNPCFAHGYSHSTVDPSTGTFYYRHAYSMKFYKYAGGQWSTIPAPPAESSICCGALEFFPDTNRLIFVEPNWGVWAYNPATNIWVQIANTRMADAKPGLSNLPMAEGSNFARYNSVKKEILLGGGTYFYKLSASGVFTPATNAYSIQTGSSQGVVTADPISGKYLIMSGQTPIMYEYDSTGDAWRTFSGVPSELYGFEGFGDGLITTPLSNYGVTMYVKYLFDSSKVYIYKH